MQPMITDLSVTARNAGSAAPQGRRPSASPIPAQSQPVIGLGCPEPNPLARLGPLRNGNPRGNPNLAPRCGAKARTTGLACRAPAMPNGRCRLHGGKSTGPRTQEGLARLAAAHTTHGLYAQTGPDADLRAKIRHVRTVARRARLYNAARNHLPWLPETLATHLKADTATELYAPPYPTPNQPAPATAVPDPDAPTHVAADLPPQARTNLPRRDAHGRFAPPPPPPLRGRQAERALARVEASALAPWRHAVAQARIARRQAVRPPPAPQATNPQLKESERNAIHRETARHPAEAHGAAGKNAAKNLIQRDTVARSAGPNAAGTQNPAKTLMQHGTAAPPAGPNPAGAKNPAKTPVQRGAVRPGQNPFRNALLSGTVSNGPDAHKLAASVRRAGGWPVMRAIEAAIDAGNDWRPAAANARSCLAQEATRQPARPSTPSPIAP